MIIGITGATGFIGRRIADLALRRGHEVIAFTRVPQRSVPGCEMRSFSLNTPPDLHGCEAVVHLAGEPLLGIWTPAKKRRVVESRLLGTRRVIEAINIAREPPEVFLSASAVGFYGDRGEVELTESSEPGSGFLAATVRAWEEEASKAQQTRVVLLRSGVVLGKSGGALKLLVRMFRCGLGARLGDGRQWMPWIHLHDEARLALFVLENMDIRGAVNGAAPWPVRNAEFTATLAKALRRPAFVHVPRWALRLAGDLSHELLDSKRVVPAVATEHGFRFDFPTLDIALDDLVR